VFSLNNSLWGGNLVFMGVLKNSYIWCVHNNSCCVFEHLGLSVGVLLVTDE